MLKVLRTITVISLVLCVCGVGWGQKSFVVTGKSEQGGDVQNPTMEMAIKNGLAKAIEEVVKGMVTPEDMSKRQDIFSEELYKKADEYILSWKILEKTPLPTGYQALLEVVVDTKEVESKLSALGFLKDREGPRLREVQVVVSGIKSYQACLTMERLLSGDEDIQGFFIAEIIPTTFTWKVLMRGDMGRLIEKILSHDFGGLKARVVSSSSERLEVVLSR